MDMWGHRHLLPTTWRGCMWAGCLPPHHLPPHISAIYQTHINIYQHMLYQTTTSAGGLGLPGVGWHHHHPAHQRGCPPLPRRPRRHGSSHLLLCRQRRRLCRLLLRPAAAARQGPPAVVLPAQGRHPGGLLPAGCEGRAAAAQLAERRAGQARDHAGHWVGGGLQRQPQAHRVVLLLHKLHRAGEAQGGGEE